MLTDAQIRSHIAAINANSQSAREGSAAAMEEVRQHAEALVAHYTEALKGKLSPVDAASARAVVRSLAKHLN